jgi:hypothetical protein
MVMDQDRPSFRQQVVGFVAFVLVPLAGLLLIGALVR